MHRLLSLAVLPALAAIFLLTAWIEPPPPEPAPLGGPTFNYVLSNDAGWVDGQFSGTITVPKHNDPLVKLRAVVFEVRPQYAAYLAGEVASGGTGGWTVRLEAEDATASGEVRLGGTLLDASGLHQLPKDLVAAGACGAGDGELDLMGPTAGVSGVLIGFLGDGPTEHKHEGVVGQFIGPGNVVLDVSGTRAMHPSYDLCTGEFYGGAFNAFGAGGPARVFRVTVTVTYIFGELRHVEA